MNTLSSRLMIVSMLVALFLVPVYAHHGNQFLSKATEMNAAEVKLGELAMNKAQNAQVKDYAQMLVNDHNQALDKIMELRSERTITSVSATTDTRNSADIHRNAADVPLMAEHQRTYQRLSALSGADFDREFINEMIRGHREAISMFEAQTNVHGNGVITRNQKDTAATQQTARQKPGDSDNTWDNAKYSLEDLRRDLDTSDFAKEMLPTLRHHLEQAESIQKQLQAKQTK
jgi:predicted outer membrane protein